MAVAEAISKPGSSFYQSTRSSVTFSSGANSDTDTETDVPTAKLLTSSIINEAIQLITEINAEDVLIEPDLFKSCRLFRNTALDRGDSLKSVASVADDDLDINEIVQRNIYYISRITNNAFDLVLQLVQRGCLSLDHKDEIISVGQFLGKFLTIPEICFVQMVQSPLAPGVQFG